MLNLYSLSLILIVSQDLQVTNSSKEENQTLVTFLKIEEGLICQILVIICSILKIIMKIKQMITLIKEESHIMGLN